MQVFVKFKMVGELLAQCDNNGTITNNTGAKGRFFVFCYV